METYAGGAPSGYRGSLAAPAQEAGPRGRGSCRFSLLVSIRRQGLVILAAAAWLLALGSPARSAGFALLQQGTAAMAQGNAFVAQADDASAIFYNPAGLNQLKRAQFYQASFFNYPDREFHGSHGEFSQTNHRLYRHLTAYFALPVHDRLALGIGFFSPFGLGTVWPPPWAGRFITTFSHLKTFNLNPVVSVKVLEGLSVAAGFNALWSSVELHRKNSLNKLVEAESTLTADADGVGYNLGLLYEPISGVKLGVAYRSDIPVTFKGDLKTELPKGHGKIPLIGGSADLTFPASVTAGVAYGRLKPFVFEFDATWTGWSSYDQLKVELGKMGKQILGTSSIVSPKNWRDSWAFRFGANYEVKPGMKFRAGYIYDLSPVPDGTFDPQLPDANRHIFSVGSDLKLWRFTLGFAYNFILSEDRTKNNTIVFKPFPPPTLQANGRYSTTVHSLGLSWSFNF